MPLHMPTPELLQSFTALGPLIRLFPSQPAKTSRAFAWAAAIAGWLIFTGAILYGAVAAYWQYYLHGPAVVWRSLLTPAMLALLGLSAGVAGQALVVHLRSYVLAVYQAGFALAVGHKLSFWRWSEIASLKHSITHQYLGWIFLGIKHQVIMKTQSGKRITLDHRLPKIEALAAIAYRKTFAVRYAVYAKAYQNGHLVRFGSLSIQAESGLRYQSQNYPWQHIQRIELTNGWLVLTFTPQSGKKEKDIPAGSLPDLDVLLRLVK